jgi:Agenet domain
MGQMRKNERRMRWHLALVCSVVACSGSVAGCADRAGAPPLVVQVPLQPAVPPTTSSAPLAVGPAGKTVSGRVGRDVGERVDVEWHDSWFPAVIVERRGERFLIHYDGYGDEWDELVSLERIRARRIDAREPDEPDEPEDSPLP